ncbi:MAG TPA: hypothetical protein VN706_01505 [Gemmatimonadaceae bacterium]|nr:hypothetical protein [Gemmatimonadaceae bacterium]
MSSERRSKSSAASVERALDGGDRRSVGQVAQLVRRVRRNPAMLGDVVAALASPRPLVAMRAADALEKISRDDPNCLAPFRRRLIDVCVRTGDPVVRWNLIQCLPRLRHRRPALLRLTRQLEVWLMTDPSAIVRATALDACVALAERDAELRPFGERLVAEALAAPSASLRARARRLSAARSAPNAR